MRSHLNVRWLLVSLAVVLAAGGGLYAYLHWRNQPESLYASARRYFEQAEEARARGDGVAARRSYEYADSQLQNLLDEKKAPRHSSGLVLRYKVLTQLSGYNAREDQDRVETTGPLLAAEQRATARNCLLLAAADPSCIEAQALALDGYFREDSYEAIAQAEPYATLIVAASPEAAGLPNFHLYQIGAHYVLAWRALHHPSPDPELALRHLNASAELESRNRNQVTGETPRWRAVALEALALKIKGERARKDRATAAARGRPDKVDVLRELREERMPAWVERLRREFDEVRTPATESEPAETVLTAAVRRSPTNLRGMLDFLLLAIDQGRDRTDLLERLRLTLDVCARLTGEQATPTILRETTRHLARLPGEVERQPEALRPRPAEWDELAARLDRLIDRAFQQNVQVDLTTFQHLTQLAWRDRRLDAVERFTRKGLQTAAARKLPADNRQVLDLRTDAAWALLLQDKTREAEEHLKVLRQHRARSGDVHLLQGLAAVLDGRLEQGVHELQLAQHHASVGKNLLSCVGLAHAGLELGAYDLALANLEKVEKFYEKQDQFNEAERLFADRLLPRAMLDLQLLRCHLGRNDPERALQYRERIQFKEEGIAASIALIDYYLLVGRSRQNGTQPARAGEAFAAARKELAFARKAAPNDIRLLAAEVRLLLSQPAVQRPLVTSAIASLVSVPAVPGAAGAGALLSEVMQNYRLRVGLEWHVRQAEEVLRAYVLTHQGSLDAMLVWVGWLSLQGRLEEAAALLNRMEEVDFPGEKRRLQLARARLLLRRQTGGPELSPLLQAMDAQGPDLASDIVTVTYLARVDPARAEQRLVSAMGRHENSGMLCLLQGQLAQARGELRQAARSFERALQYVQVRPAARQGLLTTLFELGEKESPEDAARLIGEMMVAQPNEPALLLAAADTARRQGLLRGPNSMEAALDRLEAALRAGGLEPALGPYLKAVEWSIAGRSDLASKEAERALRENPQHVPSLLLAGRLALAAGAWDTCQRLAGAVEQLPAARSDSELLSEAMLWRARALVGLGRSPDARAIYQALLAWHPDDASAHRGLVALFEQARDLGAALTWAKRWREQRPSDLEALEAQVRLLTLLDRAEEAEALAKSVKLKDSGPELLRVSAGFLKAGAIDRAEHWAQLARERSPKDAAGREAALEAQLLLGAVYLAQASQAREPTQRQTAMTRAIQIYETIYREHPGQPLAGNNLAMLLLQEREQTEAAYAIIKQLRQERSGCLMTGDRLDLDFLDTVAVVCVAAGRQDEALEVLTEAGSRYGDEPIIFLNLGRARAALKQQREAAECFNRALRLADARAEKAVDPRGKSHWQALVAAAQRELKALKR